MFALYTANHGSIPRTTLPTCVGAARIRLININKLFDPCMAEIGRIMTPPLQGCPCPNLEPVCKLITQLKRIRMQRELLLLMNQDSQPETIQWANIIIELG